MITDVVADFLTHIRNAAMVKHDTVRTPYSKLRASIAEILKKEGYVSAVKIEEEEAAKFLLITLAYSSKPGQVRVSRIRTLKRISKPGRRYYVNHKNIPRPLRGLGTVILSTSSGIVTGREAAKKGLGGEILCEIW